MFELSIGIRCQRFKGYRLSRVQGTHASSSGSSTVSDGSPVFAGMSSRTDSACGCPKTAQKAARKSNLVAVDCPQFENTVVVI